MFNLIKQFFTTKNTESTNSVLSDEDKDLVICNILIDTKTEKIGLFLDINPYNIDEQQMISQAEKLAKGLYLICTDKSYLTKLLIDNIDTLKHRSSNDSIFADNLLFFWNHYMNQQLTNNDNDPLIRPSKVFK